MVKTSKNGANCSESELQYKNKWKEVVSKFDGPTAFYDRSEKEYVYPGDVNLVKQFNNAHKDKPKQQFILNTIPYPWIGNPLKAKVIILSQNPGWVENSGKTVPLMLQQIPEAAERLLKFYEETYRLESSSFMPDNELIPNLGFSTRDVFNVMGDWYWKKRFHFLTDEDVPEQNIYDNIAVIQFIPYSSVEYAPLPKGTILPSQEFTRELIEYIWRNHHDTIFVILRGVGLWKEFLGEVGISVEDNERIIIHKDGAYRAQYISPNCLQKGGFNKIKDLLKNNETHF